MHKTRLSSGTELLIAKTEVTASAFMLAWIIDIKATKIAASFFAG